MPLPVCRLRRRSPSTRTIASGRGGKREGGLCNARRQGRGKLPPNMSILWLAAYLAGVAACLLTAAIAAVLLARRLLVPPRYDAARCTVAFFHPNANAGGGGERVLWMAIAALTDVHDRHRLKVVIYSGDADVSAAAAVLAARDRFGVNIPEDLDIELIYVARRYLLDPSRYPRLTMAGQSLGSMLLALDCVRAANPDVWIDTTGAAFTMVVAKVLAQCRTIAYVHYPTITTVREAAAVAATAARVSHAVSCACGFACCAGHDGARAPAPRHLQQR